MSATDFDLILRGGICVTPQGIVAADLGVRGERIEAIGDLRRAGSRRHVDARGCHVLPGVIDPQVHFREPGFPDKEDLETGTRAAVLGGVTTVFEMPNTDPPTTDEAAFRDKWKRAEGRVWCDVAFFVGATPENADALARLEGLPGCAGVKVFMGKSTGNLLVDRDADLARVLSSGTRRLAVHAEDETRLRERRGLVVPGDPASHPVWRDVESAYRATERLLSLARKHRRPVHVLHVTTDREVALLRRERERDPDLVTFECTPQHLTLEAPGCYAALGTHAQMNPPIREARHREALWGAVRDRTLSALGSDHAPHTRAEKARAYPESPSGMPGVQTLLPIMLDHVNRGALGLERLVELCCSGPADVYGVPDKGRLEVGGDADCVLVDLAGRHRLDDSEIASRCGWTPFHGRIVRGWPRATVLRGQLVVSEGRIVGEPQGRAVRFADSS